VVNFTPRPLYPSAKSPRYPLDRRLGGPQRRSGHDFEEKNSQPPPGIEPRSSDYPAHTQSLYRLNYSITNKNLYTHCYTSYTKHSKSKCVFSEKKKHLLNWTHLFFTILFTSIMSLGDVCICGSIILKRTVEEEIR
jgi:hypothetical protein